MSTLSRWRGNLATRTALLAHARTHNDRVHNAASHALLLKRKAQVAYAERVVKRHTVAHTHGASDRAVATIAAYEGFVGHAYKPVAAEPYWTIGYGHYGPDVHPGRTITRAQGIALLHHDIDARFWPAVAALNLPTQGMKDATLDAVFNLGVGILAPSHTFGAALHARNWTAAANALLLYDVDATGGHNRGLTARRRADRSVFLAR